MEIKEIEAKRKRKKNETENTVKVSSIKKQIEI